MKFYKKLNQYKASNLVYDLNSNKAYSYEWYELAKCVDSQMILNTYNYSPTTLRHMYKLRTLFDSLNINYVEIEAPRGLQDMVTSIFYYTELIHELNKKINNPRSRKSTNLYRVKDLSVYESKLSFVKNLIG